MYDVATIDGLAVCFQPTLDEKGVNAELKKLDPDLFLDKVRGFGDSGPYVYYAVRSKQDLGHDRPPILEWRDADGPRPLSYEIVERIKRREHPDFALDTALRRMDAENRAKRDRAREQSLQEKDDIIRDHWKRFSPAYSPGFKPRRFGAGR